MTDEVLEEVFPDAGPYEWRKGAFTEPRSPGAEDDQLVEVAIKVKMRLPAAWQKPPYPTHLGPLGKFWDEVVYDVLDWVPRKWVWDGDWKRLVEGVVDDVELDAGEWGFNCVNRETDDRSGLYIVMVER